MRSNISPVPGWATRTIEQCKRSLRRGKEVVIHFYRDWKSRGRRLVAKFTAITIEGLEMVIATLIGKKNATFIALA